MKLPVLKTLPLISILILSISVAGIADESDDAYRREPLRGLMGVQVVVEEIGRDLKNAGISEDAIKTKVELRLRTSGIRVLSEEERQATLGRPYLYVNVTSIVGDRDSDGDPLMFACSIDVSLSEDCTLLRFPLSQSAETWECRGVGVVGSQKARGVYDLVLEYVDGFCNDYLAANPKEAKYTTAQPSTQPNNRNVLDILKAMQKDLETQPSTQPSTQPQNSSRPSSDGTPNDTTPKKERKKHPAPARSDAESSVPSSVSQVAVIAPSVSTRMEATAIVKEMQLIEVGMKDADGILAVVRSPLHDPLMVSYDRIAELQDDAESQLNINGRHYHIYLYAISSDRSVFQMSHTHRTADD